MLHLLKMLIFVDLLVAAGLIAVRWSLPPDHRALVSGKLAAIALTTPAIALLSGDVRLFLLYLAVVTAFNARSRVELAGTVLALSPAMLLLLKEAPAHTRLIALGMVAAIGVGALVGRLASRRGVRRLDRAPARHRAASWIVVGLFACFAAGTGQGSFLSRVATGASMLRGAVAQGKGFSLASGAIVAGAGSVGANLYGNEYWSPEFPFLNRVKTAGVWAAQNADSASIPFTADGYPTGRPAGTTMLYTMVALDPVKAGGNNSYVLTWSGKANFSIAGGQVTSNKPGRIAFTYTRTDSNQTFFAVDGLDPAHPLGNMAVVRSDQLALYNSGEIFNPAFIDKVGKLDTVRFMDWNNINANKTANWADNTALSRYSWLSSTRSGVPIEVEVALANKAGTNMWLNVPTYATDDYVRQLVGYVHDHLDPSLSLYLEYSNEVWNWSFQQSHYASDQADKLWGNGQHFGPGWVTWYGYRAAQVASIANRAYRADAGRLHNVLGTQTAYQSLENYIVDGVSRAKLGSIDELFDDYAVTTYFGGTLSGGNDADRARILSWARGGDAGVTAAIAALKNNTGLTATDNGSLAWLRGVLAYQGAVAQKLRLHLVAYEGGIDVTQNNGFGADKATAEAFLARVRADPRMGDIYTQMTSDFAAAGGALLNIYTDVGAGYGTLNSIYDKGSPAWDALVAAETAARKRAAATPPSAPASRKAVR